MTKFISRHKIITHVIFTVSAIALAFVWSFSIKALHVNTYVIDVSGFFINLFIFTPFLVFLVFKFDLLRLCLERFSFFKFLGCGLLAVLICVRFARQSYEMLVYESQRLWSFHSTTSFFAGADSQVIKILCLSSAVLAIFSMMVILWLLFELTAFLWRRPWAYGMNGNDSLGDPKSLRKVRVVLLCLSIFMLMVMIGFSFAQSFSFDELNWTISMIANINVSEISSKMLAHGANMPLYYYALGLIYPLMPYGEGYLLSISIVTVLIGIFFLALAAKEIGGRMLSYIAFGLALLSTILITRGAWQLRPYAFLFCFSAMTTFFYFRRVKDESWLNTLLFGAVMISLMYTHWYGALLLVFYGVGDVILWLMKKIKLRFLISYLLAGAVALIWFVSVLLTASDLTVNVVYPVPDWMSVANSFDILLTSNSLLFFVFAIAVLMIIVMVFWTVKEKKWNLHVYLWFHTLLCIAWIIAATFIYSRYLYPQGSVYTERYFFIVVPHLLLVVSFGLQSIYVLLKERSVRIKILPYTAAFFVLTGTVNYYKAISFVVNVHEPYREVAELIAQSEEAYMEDTLILTSAGEDAWIDYYFLKRGYALPMNIAFGLDLMVKNGEHVNIPVTYEELYEYDKIYVWYNYFAIPPEFEKTWEDEKTKLVLYEK